MKRASESVLLIRKGFFCRFGRWTGGDITAHVNQIPCYHAMLPLSPLRHVVLLMLASLLPKFEENRLQALVLPAGSVIKGADVHSRVSAITQSLSQGKSR